MRWSLPLPAIYEGLKDRGFQFSHPLEVVSGQNRQLNAVVTIPGKERIGRRKCIAMCNPSDKEILLTLGHICIAQEKRDDAVMFYKKVLEIDPDHHEARACLG